MNTSVREHVHPTAHGREPLPENRAKGACTEIQPDATDRVQTGKDLGKIRVLVVSESPILLVSLSRVLSAHQAVQTLTVRTADLFDSQSLQRNLPDLLLFTSSGNLQEDISLIRRIRNTLPAVRIVLFDGVTGQTEFLQYVRAGIRGYVLPDASAEDVVKAIVDVCQGEVVCPGLLCAALFRYFELEATTLPSAAMRQSLGLTRREQQLIPLIARGLTNKEIANHFCLSEQTVKNHLYRMKHKVGAGNRLGIVQSCHTQGFLL